MEAEGIYDHLKEKKDDCEESKVNNTSKPEFEKIVPSHNDESYLETLDNEMSGLVCSLKDDWPLEWMRNKQEIAKLKRVMTRKKKSRRHELFMDSKQRVVKGCIPELIKISNQSFMNLFGKKREIIDRDVRIFVKHNIFDKTVESKDFDPRLKNLLKQSQVKH